MKSGEFYVPKQGTMSFYPFLITGERNSDGQWPVEYYVSTNDITYEPRGRTRVSSVVDPSAYYTGIGTLTEYAIETYYIKPEPRTVKVITWNS